MSRTRIMESRALDHYYDPVYTTPVSDNSSYKAPRPAILADGGQPVGGRNTYKFMKRPVVPMLNSMAPEVFLAPSSGEDPLQAPPDEVQPFTKSAGTQTKYRESEAQTAPYTPDYVLGPEQEEPEVLMLQGLTHGAGLPVGPRELEMLEHARHKRLLEASLPPFTDEASLSLRRRVMEAQEMKEFKLRDRELARVREERLEALKKALEDQDQSNEFLAQQRIEGLRQAKVREREAEVARIQRKRLKVLRKLSKARQSLSVPSDHRGRDIIEEYADYGSGVYAPVRREGRRVDKDGEKFDITRKAAGVDGYQSMAGLESSIPASLMRSVVQKPSRAKQWTSGTLERKALAASASLEAMTQILLSRKTATPGSKKATATPATPAKDATIPPGTACALGATMPLWRTKIARKERPQTPRVADAPPDAAVQVAVLLLQRLIRGRAVQNNMYEGKERRKELIRELRAGDEAELSQGPEALETLEELAAEERRQRVHAAALDAVAGEVFGYTLRHMNQDYLYAAQHQPEGGQDHGAAADVRSEGHHADTEAAGHQGRLQSAQPVEAAHGSNQDSHDVRVEGGT